MLRTWSNPGLLSGSKTKRNGRAILWRTLFSDSNLSCNQFRVLGGGWVSVWGVFCGGGWFVFWELVLFLSCLVFSFVLSQSWVGWVFAWLGLGGLGVFFGGWCYLSCLVLASLLGWLMDFFFFFWAWGDVFWEFGLPFSLGGLCRLENYIVLIFLL